MVHLCVYSYRFKGFDADVTVMRGKDYSAALDVIEDWMKSDTGMRQETVHDWDDFFERYATVEPSEILVTGQVWAGCIYVTCIDDLLVVYTVLSRC